MTDLALILPSIRTANLDRLYDELCVSLQRYSFELFVVSPYPLTAKLQDKRDVRLLKSYACPTRCFQEALLLAEARAITTLADDVWLFPNKLDEGLDLLASLSERDIVVLKYTEGAGHSGAEMPDEYHKPKFHDLFKHIALNDDYLMGPWFLMDTAYCCWLGGLDCRYESINTSAHSLLFRAQDNGSKVKLLPGAVGSCDHLAGRSGDHYCIHDASIENDYPRFLQDYRSFESHPPIQIDLLNYRYHASPIWPRRFA